MTTIPAINKNTKPVRQKKKKNTVFKVKNNTMHITNAAQSRLQQLQILQRYNKHGLNQRPGSLGNMTKHSARERLRANLAKKRFSIANADKNVLNDVEQERNAIQQREKNAAKQEMNQYMKDMTDENGYDANSIINEDIEHEAELPLSPVIDSKVFNLMSNTDMNTNNAGIDSLQSPTSTAKQTNESSVAKNEIPVNNGNTAGNKSTSIPPPFTGDGQRKGSWMDRLPFINRKQGRKMNQKPKKVVFQVKKEKFELYSHLKPTKMLGEGAYAAVCEIQDMRTKKKYAVKKNRDVFSNISDARRILREIKLMIHFDHPHVMSLLDVVPPDLHQREDFNDVYLIMPRMDTTLSKVIRSQQKLSERHIQYFVYQIMRGLEYMHSGGVIHRDLKPENILVDAADCKLKITDFGLARGVIQDSDTPLKLTEYVVTRWYRAPEVMCCSRLYDSQIDTWALGCIAAELYTRRPLFKGRNHIEQLQLIFHYMGTPSDLSWIKTNDAKKWISQMTKKPAKDMASVLPKSTEMTQDFVKQLLIVNPAERPTITKALKHPWLKDFYREKDYKACPHFNISFEFEAKIKTGFGVRHMMYEELNNFYQMTQAKKMQKMVDMQSVKNNNTIGGGGGQ